MADHLLASKPNLMPHWRIMTPGLSLAYLLLYVLALLRALDHRTRSSLLVAGVACGLLFHVYFYYWTAAGLSLLLCAVFLRSERQVFLATGSIGLVVGLPSLVSTYLLPATQNADWLARTDKFIQIGHLQELILPKIGPMLAMAAVVYAFVRQPRLRFLGLHVLAGLALLNHQVITGLQIENFHYSYFWGPLCSALLVLIALDHMRQVPRGGLERRWVLGVIGAVVALQFSTGFYLRLREVTDSQEAVQLNHELREFKRDLQAHGVSKTPNSVIAGDRGHVRLSVVLEDQRPLSGYVVDVSAVVSDEQWAERIALDAVLSGVNATTFALDQRRALDRNVWGPWARDEALKRQLLELRLAKHRWAATNLPYAIDRYEVGYVALPRGASPDPYVARNWEEVGSEAWSVWRNPRMFE